MSSERDPEKANVGSSSVMSSSGSSTLTGDGSPPRTPPEEDEQTLPKIQHAPHSSNPPKRGRRSKNNSPPTRLGAIDEDSNDVAPDVPPRNPNRIFGAGAAKLFGFGLFASSRDHADDEIPPPNIYDKITGPRGEKFTDVRRNRPVQRQPRSKKTKIIIAAAAAVIILAIALGVGLGVGLSRRKSSSEPSSSVPASSNGNTTQAFPIGQYQFPAYLTTTSTNCTSISETWSCYPYQTYSPNNAAGSLTSMTWQITSPTDSTGDLQISNNNPTFSYPFTNVSLHLSDSNDPRLAAYTFSFSYRKVVAPAVSISSSNMATRCYFNNTLVSVRLYVDSQGAGGDVAQEAQGQATWPNAFEYAENSADAPECFEYVNGENTQPVSVSGANGICQCAYRNYGLS